MALPARPDPVELRYQRAARARELCLLRMREHLGQHLPRPVISAINELVDTVLRLGATSDDDLEQTVVARRP